MTHFLNFSGRGSYLEQRAAWRHAYHVLTEQQRLSKSELKEAHRRDAYADVVRSQRQILANKQTAAAMLDALQRAKQEAQSQYLRGRELARVVA